MVEIDIEQQKARYQTEHDRFVIQLQQLDNQRAMLIQAIQERRGIICFLDNQTQPNKEAK